MTKMRCCFSIMIFFTICSLAMAGGDNPSPANEYVKCAVTLKENSLRAGSRRNLLIALKPKAGIHVNIKPPIGIVLDSTGVIEKVESPMIPKADTLLNTSKPISQPIVVAKSVKPGAVTLKGTITYYYCSDAEGWCSRFKQPFELTVNVVK